MTVVVSPWSGSLTDTSIGVIGWSSVADWSAMSPTTGASLTSVTLTVTTAVTLLPPEVARTVRS